MQRRLPLKKICWSRKVAKKRSRSPNLQDWIEDGERSQHVYVGAVPEPVGPGRGAVVLIAISVDSSTGYDVMVDAIRDRIGETHS